jgi:CxxC motif-containing protein
MSVKKIRKKFICIRCPRGCEISTTIDGYTIDIIEGNVCKMGVEYVESEIKDPRRIITTTVKVKNGKFPLVPVWTVQPVPKDKIFPLMKELRKIELKAPINIDKIILKNVLNTGIDIITSGIITSGKVDVRSNDVK